MLQQTIRRCATLLACIALASSAAAETQTIRPRYARPDDIEKVVSRVVPQAGVAAVNAQNSVLISGSDEVLEEVNRVIRELDQPGQVVELEIALTGATMSSNRSRGLGGSLRGGKSKSEPITPPSELSSDGGSSSSNAVQSLVAMPGRPAEVTIGDSVLRDGGPLAPPVEVQTGKRVAIDGLRVIEDKKGVEMDVQVEDTIPGAGPVVSSGTRAKTSVRLMLGQTQVIAGSVSETEADSSSSALNNQDRNTTAQTRRRQAQKMSVGQVAITLKAIR